MTEAFFILACMLLSFLFSGMETAILLVNSARIRHLKEKGSRGARILLDLMHRPSELSATVLVANTLVNVSSTVVVANYFLHRGGVLGAVAAVALYALLLWFLGDVVPKTLFHRFPNLLSTKLAPLLEMAYWGLLPLVLIFQFLSRLMVRSMGGSVSVRHMFVTREELKLLSKEVSQGGALSGEQRMLVSTILESAHVKLHDAMVPRIEVATTPSGAPDAERIRSVLEEGFSRLPVEGPGTDPNRPFEGLWVSYDLLFEGKSRIRQPPRLEAEMPLEDVLPALRKAASPMAFVKDRLGHDIGIVTVEDVLSRYFGKMDL